MELCPPNSTPLSQEAYSQVQVGLGWELEIWVLTKWTTRNLSCLLVNIGKSYPGLLQGKSMLKSKLFYRKQQLLGQETAGPWLLLSLVWHRPSCWSLATRVPFKPPRDSASASFIPLPHTGYPAISSAPTTKDPGHALCCRSSSESRAVITVPLLIT